jgi:hypothetical protein
MKELVGPKIAKEIISVGEDRLSVERARTRDRQQDRARRLARSRDRACGASPLRDPGLVKQTKRAINYTLERQGLLDALEAALAIDLDIEGPGARQDGLHGYCESRRAEGGDRMARRPLSREAE